MGVHPNVSHDRFPPQGDWLYKRVSVCFNYDTENEVPGQVVRDDTTDPGRMIIRLDDDRYVMSTECQYREAHE
jgi:hypothetical protein